ncbi:MAG: MMPL family transporter [Verrucomicrobia bacterium]|nr:MMPL family transporter [Verrucomicrobiota bacterium]
MQKHSAPIHQRIMERLCALLNRYPAWFVLPQILLAALAVFYTIKNLEFTTDRNVLVGSDRKYHKDFMRFQDEFQPQDDLVVVIESEDMSKNRRFVETLAARLQGRTNLFSEVFFKGDLKLLGKKALLFLPEETLRDMLQMLREYRPFIQKFSNAQTLEGLFQLVNNQFRTANNEDSPENRSMVNAIPALKRIIEDASKCLDRAGRMVSPGIYALFGAEDEAESEIYVTFAEGRIYLLTAKAASKETTPEAIAYLRNAIELTQRQVPGVNVGLTGEPVLELDEMSQSKRDTLTASIVSFILVTIIFIFGYHETGRPLKTTACLLLGLIYTMAFATLTVGYLNILTITFLPMLIGLAIDFGIHLVTRFEEELQLGKTKHKAIETALVFTGKGIFTSSVTTSAAFFAMAFTDFKGIQEMGIICGGGMLICLIPMTTALPALLLRGKQNIIDHKIHNRRDHRRIIEQFYLNRPGLILTVTGASLILAATGFNRVFFDYNLLNLQTRGLESVVFERKLIDSTSKSVLYAAVVTDTAEKAVDLKKQIERLPSVADVESVAQYFVENPDTKLQLIDKIKGPAAEIDFPEVDSKNIDPGALNQTLWSLQGYLGLALRQLPDAATQNGVEQKLRDLRNAIIAFRTRLLNHRDKEALTELTAYQEALFQDVRETFHAIEQQDTSGGLTPGDLPESIRNRFIGRTGKHLLQVYPKKDVWQRENQEEFISQIRKVHNKVTGAPVQLYEYTTLLKNSYINAAYYAIAAICIMSFIHFRNFITVVLVLLPVGIGSAWTVGIMGLTGIPFNPANIMTLPLVVGIGVANGIHILNRYTEEKHPAILAKSTGKAIIVSALTTIAGFGSLNLAKHQGIASLGFLMSVGTASCMLASLVSLPSILQLKNRFAGKRKAR